ncbi:uncharacterized protein LOC114359834 isoform X3 [Ostrinia furnacalis]|uniref:uncharacterized protein LOC114359834 isoform X3 n=1 Tax=Ostrinia furnacalis TaxID=93504 RepID=UPI001038C51C|nr:uncharacterized protein LOC114359834 isoform X3 [Ostrinia furnacalis]
MSLFFKFRSGRGSAGGGAGAAGAACGMECGVAAGAGAFPARAPHPALSPTERSPAKSGLHVNFSDKGEVKERREKFLTAKYGSHQMALIRKRLAVEMWLYDELQKLFEAPDLSFANRVFVPGEQRRGGRGGRGRGGGGGRGRAAGHGRRRAAAPPPRDLTIRCQKTSKRCK